MNPLSGFGSLPEYHPTSPRCAASLPRPPRSFRGFPPLQRFRSVAEPQPPAGSRPVRLRCVLRVSLPLDALLPTTPPGLIPSRSRSWGSPFEAFLRPRCRTSSRTPSPSWGFAGSCGFRLPLQGFFTRQAARPRAWGLIRFPASIASLGFCLPRLPASAAGVSRRCSPLALPHQGRASGQDGGAPGFQAAETECISLETHQPP